VRRAPERFVESFGPVRDGDAFDLEFWQSLTTSERCAAAWELVVYFERRRGRNPDELTLQRTAERFGRQER
jgi:hypothetical protein